MGGGDGKDGGKCDYGGKKDGYDGKKDDGKKDDSDGKKGRQLAGHDHHDDDHDDDDDDNMEKKKEEYGDKKEGDKKDKEPSAELKAATKACLENKLCKQLMDCKKKHKESGGKGDGKGDHEVCF